MALGGRDLIYEVFVGNGKIRLGYGMHYSRRSVDVAAFHSGTAEELFGHVCCHSLGTRLCFTRVLRGVFWG